MGLKSENFVEINSSLKRGQRVMLIDGKWVVAGVGGKTGGVASVSEVGVVVEVDGVKMVQPLQYDGITPSDKGSPVSADGFYTFATGHDFPGGGSSGGGGSSDSCSMEIYKCAAVHEASAGNGYIVEGAGTAEANGIYTFSESTENYYDVYTNENGCMLWEMHDMETGVVEDLELHGTTSDVCYYLFSVSDGVVGAGDVLDGQTPAPTVRKAEPSEASWDGYKYDLDTKTFSETLTEGLEYKMASPIVGKVYNADTTMEIEYVPLAGIPNENIILNYPMTDLKLNTNNGFLFTDGGVPELITDGVARLRISYDGGKLETQKTLLQGLSEFTVSLWVKFYTMPSGEHAWIFYESGYSDYSRVLIDVNRDSNNHVGFYVRDTTTGDTGTWRSVYSNTVIQANKFYHIAVVYSAEEQSLYINGALEYKGTGGASLTDSASPSKGGITIGPDKPSAEDITHLRVFSKALNVDQVTILYNELSRLVTE